MTARQIRIACCGMVVSTRPYPDPITVGELMRIRDEVRADFDALLPHGRVTVWVDEAGSNVCHLMGGAR